MVLQIIEQNYNIFGSYLAMRHGEMKEILLNKINSTNDKLVNYLYHRKKANERV